MQLVLVGGLIVLIQAFVRFVMEGFGKPAPIAAPERLVVEERSGRLFSGDASAAVLADRATEMLGIPSATGSVASLEPPGDALPGSVPETAR